MNYGVGDFSQVQWSHLLDAMRKINPDVPLHATLGLCGNIVTAVQLLTDDYGPKDKPEVNLMLEVVFRRLDVNERAPFAGREDPAVGQWEGTNKRLRVQLLERMLVEVHGIVHAPKPATPPVAYLGVAA